MAGFIVMQVCPARVNADARQLRLRSHLKKDTFAVQKHLLCILYTNKILLHSVDDDKARIGWLATPQICQHDYIKGLCLNGFPIGNVWQTFECHNYLTLCPNEALLSGLRWLQNEPNFMLVRYSIVELLMVFEVSAQREHTIVLISCNKICFS